MRRGALMVLLLLLVPAQIQAEPVSPRFVEVVAAGGHSCGRTQEGNVHCWGANYLGQLGDGTTADRSEPAAVSPAGGLRPGQAVAITAGLTHTCALTRQGTVFCWGYNGSGRLGDGSAEVFRPVPVRAAVQLGTVRSVSAGGRHTCAITLERRLFCWGDNSDGQLGDGTTVGGGARAVRLEEDALAVSGGTLHTCALTRSRRLWCFGNGSFGQLGDEAHRGSLVPRLVHRGDGLVHGQITSVDSGAMHTCATVSAGSVSCWGSNTYGELGVGSLESRAVPTRVTDPALTTLVADGVSAGVRHTCVIDRGGTAFCWGDNTFGQLGSGAGGVSPMPTRVAGPHVGVPFRTVAAGQEHSCGVNRDGVTLCWGSNVNGRAGVTQAMPVLPLAMPVEAPPA